MIENSLSDSSKKRKLKFSASFEEMELDQLLYNLSLTPEERLANHKKMAMKVYAKELNNSNNRAKKAPKVMIFRDER
jgi:hypothetical protein